MSDIEDLRNKFTRPGGAGTPNLPARQPEKKAAAKLPAVTAQPPAAAGSGDGASSGGIARLLETIGRLLSPKPRPPEAAAPEPPIFTVAVATLGNDPEGAYNAQLLAVLKERPALTIRPVGRVFTLENMEDPVSVSALSVGLRQTIAQEGADLLIWGAMVKDGYALYLSGALYPDDDRPGSFGFATRFDLPVTLDAAMSDLLYGAVLSAADAMSEAKKGAVRRLLPGVMQNLEALAVRPPIQLSLAQQRAAQVAYGHGAAVAALAGPPSQADDWFEKALTIYRAAQKRLNRTDPDWEAGFLHRHIACLLTARAERAKDPAGYLAEAVEEWRQAVQCFSRASMPHDWASAHIRLGKALYRLDLVSGDTELLREALQVLQASFQVYSRTETPQKWADIMHDVAQVLQVYGDQLRKPDVLQRSIDACDSVLQIVARERQPMAWAAAQNTLGSALFLYDKHGGGTANLDRAAAALEAAAALFQTSGAKRPAQVAARNLAHVRKLAEERRGRSRGVVDPGWARE